MGYAMVAARQGHNLGAASVNLGKADGCLGGLGARTGETRAAQVSRHDLCKLPGQKNAGRIGVPGAGLGESGSLFHDGCCVGGMAVAGGGADLAELRADISFAVGIPDSHTFAFYQNLRDFVLTLNSILFVQFEPSPDGFGQWCVLRRQNSWRMQVLVLSLSFFIMLVWALFNGDWKRGELRKDIQFLCVHFWGVLWGNYMPAVNWERFGTDVQGPS